MYRRRIAQFSREQLLFIDESAKDERTFQVWCKEFAIALHMNHPLPLLYAGKRVWTLFYCSISTIHRSMLNLDGGGVFDILQENIAVWFPKLIHGWSYPTPPPPLSPLHPISQLKSLKINRLPAGLSKGSLVVDSGCHKFFGHLNNQLNSPLPNQPNTKSTTNTTL